VEGHAASASAEDNGEGGEQGGRALSPRSRGSSTLNRWGGGDALCRIGGSLAGDDGGGARSSSQADGRRRDEGCRI